MFGNLGTIKHEPIELSKLAVGDVFGYGDVGGGRYFILQRLNRDQSNDELYIQEYTVASNYECNPSSGGSGRYGGGFSYGVASAQRNFTRVISMSDKVVKMLLCRVVASALFATDELRKLLVELEV